MPFLTYQNHFKFGYDGDWFRPRRNDTEQFTFEYGRCSRMPGSWLSESLEAARIIEGSTDLPINVLFSGGMDSEVAMEAFRLAGIPVTAIILRMDSFAGCINDHDIKYAINYCEQHSIKYKVIDLEVVTFFERGEMERYADLTQASSPQQTVTMWLADQIDGFPVLGQGETYITRVDDHATRAAMVARGADPEDNPLKDDWRLSPDWWVRERERTNGAWYRFFLARGRDAAPGFHQYTPEQVLSYITDPGVMTALRVNYSTDPAKFNTYRRHFEIKPRPKYTGFERIPNLVAKWRDALKTKPLHGDGIANVRYLDIVASMTPEPQETKPAIRNGVVRVEFAESCVLLRKLWSDWKVIRPIDDVRQRITIPEDRRDQIEVVTLMFYQNGAPLGTTHAYATGEGLVRIRGTYVEPAFRNSSIAKDLIEAALGYFPTCHTAYTFPRIGSEGFYQKINFEIVGGPYMEFNKGVYEAVRKLR